MVSERCSAHLFHPNLFPKFAFSANGGSFIGPLKTCQGYCAIEIAQGGKRKSNSPESPNRGAGVCGALQVDSLGSEAGSSLEVTKEGKAAQG